MGQRPVAGVGGGAAPPMYPRDEVSALFRRSRPLRECLCMQYMCLYARLPMHLPACEWAYTALYAKMQHMCPW